LGLSRYTNNPQNNGAKMSNELEIGTKLNSEYGVWTIIGVTHYDGDVWYDIKAEIGNSVAVVYPSQIGSHYTVV
jgi:hypothetical protein